MNALFPDSFLAAIEHLNLRINLAPAKSLAGAHLSRAAGASLEFRDYQMYTPGDDLRRVDWNVYARTRHLFVRRFERPTAVPIFILVDASGSMLLEELPGTANRYTTAARLAASVMSAALASQNPVYLTIADQHASPAPHALTGRRGFVRGLTELSQQREGSILGISRQISSLASIVHSRGPGVMVVISDFFDDAGVDAVLDALRTMPGRLLLLQVSQPWDENPQLIEDLELTDCESNSSLQISPDPAILEQYHRAYKTYFAALKDFALLRGATFASFDTGSSLLVQLERLFPGGTVSL
jgi:uncharacterized protein (DUF58 family)